MAIIRNYCVQKFLLIFLMTHVSLVEVPSLRKVTMDGCKSELDVLFLKKVTIPFKNLFVKTLPFKSLFASQTQGLARKFNPFCHMLDTSMELWEVTNSKLVVDRFKILHLLLPIWIQSSRETGMLEIFKSH